MSLLGVMLVLLAGKSEAGKVKEVILKGEESREMERQCAWRPTVRKLRNISFLYGGRIIGVCEPDGHRHAEDHPQSAEECQNIEQHLVGNIQGSTGSELGWFSVLQ